MMDAFKFIRVVLSCIVVVLGGAILIMHYQIFGGVEVDIFTLFEKFGEIANWVFLYLTFCFLIFLFTFPFSLIVICYQGYVASIEVVWLIPLQFLVFYLQWYPFFNWAMKRERDNELRQNQQKLPD